MSDIARRLLVISPHLDDAVFSCAAALAGSPGATVCTVFAGSPHAPIVTDWDRQCGFANAHEAMRARHVEDAAALDVVGARAVHLGFLDSQYVTGDTAASADAIAAAIRDELRRADADTLVIPLGLFHSDHALTHDACRRAWLSDTSIHCIAYEDCLYRRMDGLLQARLAELAAHDIIATPALDKIDVHNLEAKRRAVHYYTSQLKAFGPNGYDDVFSPERFWTLRLDHHAH